MTLLFKVEFTDSAERARLDSDPMYALEKGKKDKNILTDRKPALGKLQLENAIRHGDNFELNRQLRAGLRHAKARDGTATMEDKHMAKGGVKLHVKTKMGSNYILGVILLISIKIPNVRV